MKKMLAPMLLGLVSVLVIGNAYADANSANQRCQSNAGKTYDACSRRDRSGCDADYDRAMNQCGRTFNEMYDEEQRGAKFDNNGRFTPTQIPQRPGYVSPGMR